MSLCAAILLVYISSSINEGIQFFTPKRMIFRTTIHEDYMGALKLAKLEPVRYTSRSKFMPLNSIGLDHGYFQPKMKTLIRLKLFIVTLQNKKPTLWKIVGAQWVQNMQKTQHGLVASLGSRWSIILKNDREYENIDQIEETIQFSYTNSYTKI